MHLRPLCDSEQHAARHGHQRINPESTREERGAGCCLGWRTPLPYRHAYRRLRCCSSCAPVGARCPRALDREPRPPVNGPTSGNFKYNFKTTSSTTFVRGYAGHRASPFAMPPCACPHETARRRHTRLRRHVPHARPAVEAARLEADCFGPASRGRLDARVEWRASRWSGRQQSTSIYVIAHAPSPG